MKKIFAILLSFLSFTFFIACSKSKSDSPANAQSMTASINGQSFTATRIGVNTLSSNGDTTTYIYGDDDAGHEVELIVLKSIKTITTGTYSMDTGIVAAARYTNGLSVSNAASGSITITSINSTNIKGTFNFITADTINVTGGAFNARVPQ